MKKSKFFIPCSLIIGILFIFTLFFAMQNKKGIRLNLVFDQESYLDSDFICYHIEVENKENYPIYYQYDSFSIDISSDQGFHATAAGKGNTHRYELAPEGIISKNMTGYNQYPYMLAAGITDFSALVKKDETAEPEVAELTVNWATGLNLPAGTYQFHVKFLYYLDKNDISEPLTTEYTKEMKIHGEGSKALEEKTVIQDRIVFYAKTNKTIYKTGERLQTWGMYDWFEDGWFPLDYYYYLMPLWIGLIDQNGEEIEIYPYDLVNILPLYPETYCGALYIEPRTRYIETPGNYIISYHFGYYMEPGGELHWSSIDFPITVIENDTEKEFYSNPLYCVPAVEQIK